MSSDSLQSEIDVDDDISLLRRDAEVDLDDETVASIFLKYRHQLERMIEFRIDQRIRSPNRCQTTFCKSHFLK